MVPRVARLAREESGGLHAIATRPCSPARLLELRPIILDEDSRSFAEIIALRTCLLRMDASDRTGYIDEVSLGGFPMGPLIRRASKHVHAAARAAEVQRHATASRMVSNARFRRESFDE